MGHAKVAFWEHFRRLLDFSGREDRASFWPYAALVFGIVTLGIFAAMIPPMFSSIRRIHDYAAAHPEEATVVSGPGHYSVSVEGSHPEFMPDMGAMVAAMAIITLAAVGLYAAAVVRRLHDTGRSGWLSLMPLPFLAYSLSQMTRMLGSAGLEKTADMAVFLSVFFSNLLYLIALVTLIVLLAGNSDPQPNRYDRA